MKKNLLLLSTLLLNVVAFSQAVFTSNVTYPTTGVVGQNTATISFTYTSTATATYEFQIIPFDASASAGVGDLAYGHEVAYVQGLNLLPATATPVTITTVVAFINSTCKNPANLVGPTPGSTALPSPYTQYRWFGKLSTGGVDRYSNQPAINISAPLGINDFSINHTEMFVNSASKSLVINANNIKSESAIIYDTTGRSVAKIDNLKQANDFDLSTLDNGIYFVVTNDRRNLKFVL
jgi:hypothetical protein